MGIRRSRSRSRAADHHHRKEHQDGKDNGQVQRVGLRKRDDAAVESIKRDALEIADAHGGEVVDYGNGEWVVNSPSGEEVARWEMT